MISTSVLIGSTSGLHSRPASVFVRAAIASRQDVRVLSRGETADGKSVLALTALRLNRGDRVTLNVSGDNEEATARVLADLLASNLGAR